jgi:DNA-binding winged helix-turn-helix (wHTH) protein
LNPGIKNVVVLGKARASDGRRSPSARPNEALVPLVAVFVNASDIDATLRELAMRIESVLRERLAKGPDAGKDMGPDAARRNAITVGDLFIDPDAHRVTVKGEEVSLTGLEFKLLVALTEHSGRVYPRGALLADVWASHALNRTRTVDTHVKRLRDKLKGAGRLIQTVRGIGYRFSETPSVRRTDAAESRAPTRRSERAWSSSNFVDSLRSGAG